MSDERRLDVLAICGSLRAMSFNRLTVRALAETAPARFAIRERSGKPEPVRRFCAEIAAADGVLIATPEYLYSVPGVLKNAIDWTAGKPSVFEDKPVAIVSAATNAQGGARAQYDLRRILQANRALVMPGPEVFIGGARAKFDAEGRLTDEPARAGLLELIVAFGAWIERFRGAAAPQPALR